MQSALFHMANKAYTLMMKAATELGITPSTRPAIVAVPPPAAPSNPFSRHMRRRPGRARDGDRAS